MNIYPLHAIPARCFPTGLNKDQKLLRDIRNLSKPTHGFFVVRYAASNNPSATFTLSGGPDHAGRWLLGRIRKHKTQPGRFEIVIRRAKTCYYRVVDGNHDLAEELRFMSQDADAEFSDSQGMWMSVQDSEFQSLGFS